MGNYILASVLFVFLLFPKLVVSRESTLNNVYKIEQLFCDALGQDDIIAFLGEMGTVETKTTTSSSGSSTYVQWRVKTNKIANVYSVRYKRIYRNKNNELRRESICVSCRSTPFFQNKSDAKYWLARYGTIVVDPDSMDIGAISDGETLDDSTWSVSVDEELDFITVEWTGDRHAERLCK